VRIKDLKIKNQEGFSKLEMVFSIGLLLIVISFSWMMLEKQKEYLLRSNQNLEITATLHQIKLLLEGKGCTENFSGLSYNKRESAIEGIKGIDAKDQLFYWFRVKEPLGKRELHLSIDSYSLRTESRQNQSGQAQISYLDIEFNRGQALGQSVEPIKIYIQSKSLPFIDKCSLHPFSRENDLWKDQNEGLIMDGDTLSINTQSSTSSLNILGGLYVESSVIKCNRDQWGTLMWDTIQNRWVICQERGLTSLEDKRIISFRNLKELGKESNEGQ